MTEGLTTPSDASVAQLHALTAFHRSLEKKGVDVSQLELTDSGDVELEYSMREGSEYDRDQELFYILGAYHPYREEGDLGSLTVRGSHTNGSVSGYDSEYDPAYDYYIGSDPDVVGTWTAKREWYEQLGEGLSDEQFLTRVSQTLEVA